MQLTRIVDVALSSPAKVKVLRRLALDTRPRSGRALAREVGMNCGRRSAIARYLESCRAIPGWLERPDGQVFAQVCELQTRAGLTADLLEIGAYCGRSAILLGFLLEDGERLFVCDTFEDQPAARPQGSSRWANGKRHYPGLKQAAFEANYGRYHRVPPVIVKCLSTGLLPGGLVRPPLRIVHIDGSHEPHVIAQDIATARALLAPGGVVIFEDDHSLKNAAVAPAVRSAVQRGELRPLCMTPWKLYATIGPDPLGLTPALATWAGDSPEFELARRPLEGREVLLLYPRARRPGPWRRLDRKAGVAPPASPGS